MFLQEIISWTPPPPPPGGGGGSPPVLSVLFLRVYMKLEKGALITSLHWPGFDAPYGAQGCRLTFLTCMVYQESARVNFFFRTLYPLDVAQ